jgi:hypothetical protein
MFGATYSRCWMVLGGQIPEGEFLKARTWPRYQSTIVRSWSCKTAAGGRRSQRPRRVASDVPVRIGRSTVSAGRSGARGPRSQLPTRCLLRSIRCRDEQPSRQALKLSATERRDFRSAITSHASEDDDGGIDCRVVRTRDERWTAGTVVHFNGAFTVTSGRCPSSERAIAGRTSRGVCRCCREATRRAHPRPMI